MKYQFDKDNLILIRDHISEYMDSRNDVPMYELVDEVLTKDFYIDIVAKAGFEHDWVQYRNDVIAFFCINPDLNILEELPVKANNLDFMYFGGARGPLPELGSGLRKYLLNAYTCNSEPFIIPSTWDYIPETLEKTQVDDECQEIFIDGQIYGKCGRGYIPNLLSHIKGQPYIALDRDEVDGTYESDLPELGIDPKAVHGFIEGKERLDLEFSFCPLRNQPSRELRTDINYVFVPITKQLMKLLTSDPFCHLWKSSIFNLDFLRMHDLPRIEEL